MHTQCLATLFVSSTWLQLAQAIKGWHMLYKSYYVSHLIDSLGLGLHWTQFSKALELLSVHYTNAKVKFRKLDRETEGKERVFIFLLEINLYL